jgi:hypothetical protein
MKESISNDVGKTLEAWRTSEDVRIKMKAQTGSNSFQFRTPGTDRTKTDAHIAYRVGFGCSLYGWKDNFKKLPMKSVSGPNSSGVDRNHLYKLTSRICSGGAPLFWPDGSCIQWKSIRDASYGLTTTLNPIYSVAAVILREFCLSYSVKNSSPIDWFVRPQLECLINHLQFFRLCSSLFSFVSSIHRQGKVLVARSIVQRMIDNQSRSDAAITGFESC